MGWKREGEGPNRTHYEAAHGEDLPFAIRVLIVTDIRLYSEGLALILARHPDLIVIGWTASAGEVLPRILDTEAQVVLLDMAMPDSQAIARTITLAIPEVRVVALAIPDSERVVLDCAESGVTGYVLREASADDLITALRSAGSGELRCPPSVAAIIRRRLVSPADAPNAPGRSGLTARELEVLALVDQGLGNKAIAQMLGIEVATVKNHVHNILEKLSVHRRGEAVARARGRLTLPVPRV
jgi:DNA-binding NarL/FixJ family response regulator